MYTVGRNGLLILNSGPIRGPDQTGSRLPSWTQNEISVNYRWEYGHGRGLKPSSLILFTNRYFGRFYVSLNQMGLYFGRFSGLPTIISTSRMEWKNSNMGFRCP